MCQALWAREHLVRLLCELRALGHHHQRLAAVCPCTRVLPASVAADKSNAGGTRDHWQNLCTALDVTLIACGGEALAPAAAVM